MVTEAAAAGNNREAALTNLQQEAQQAVQKARQQLDAATATHAAVHQKVCGGVFTIYPINMLITLHAYAAIFGMYRALTTVALTRAFNVH
jgi:hypothetical protein